MPRRSLPGALAALAATALLAAGCGGSGGSDDSSSSAAQGSPTAATTSGATGSGSSTAANGTGSSTTSSGSATTTVSTSSSSTASAPSSATSTGSQTTGAPSKHSGATHLSVADHRAVARGESTFGRDVTAQSATAAKADAGKQARTLARLAREYAGSPVGAKVQAAARAWADAAGALSSGTETQINRAEAAAIKADAGL